MREKDYEHWFISRWRPALAWVYGIICLFDFLVAPILLGAYALHTKTALQQWTPLTVSGGGLFHVSFGAIIGVTSFGRTKEKLQDQGKYSNTTPQEPQ